MILGGRTGSRDVNNHVIRDTSPGKTLSALAGITVEEFGRLTPVDGDGLFAHGGRFGVNTVRVTARMSRNAAQKAFSIEDLKQQTSGVICRKDKGVIDEIPGAYKNIDEVMANQSDLVEVVHTLKQVLCVKG